LTQAQFLLKDLAKRLAEIEGVDSPDIEARWILERAWGRNPLLANKDHESELDPTTLQFIETALQERSRGLPLAYVLGEKEFYGLTFMVNQNVLIPRPETEHLVDFALDWCRRNQLINPRIVDLGSGSGCLGLTLIKNLPQAKLFAVDISVDALDVTDFNSKSLAVHDRVTLYASDASDVTPNDLPGDFGLTADLVVANPPYIDSDDTRVDPWVRKFEPKIALFSDENGLGHIRRWVQSMALLLRTGGLALCEFGCDQSEQVFRMVIETNQFNNLKIHQDYSGRSRFISMERKRK